MAYVNAGAADSPTTVSFELINRLGGLGGYDSHKPVMFCVLSDD